MSLLWLGLGMSLAQACDLPDTALELDINGFGLIRVGTLDGDGEPFFLSNGVCVAGISGWQLSTDEAVVDLTEGAFQIEVGAVTLVLADLTLTATRLLADEVELVLTELKFESGDLTGRADEGRYDLTTGVTTLLNPSASSDSFSVVGSSAVIADERLSFKDAVATTCVCVDAPFYVVNAEEAVYKLRDSSISVRAGSLDVAGLSIDFEQLEVNQDTFDKITFPLSIEYVSDNAATGVAGTGLGVRVKGVPLAEDLALELGVQGLDVNKPLRGVALVHYRNSVADTTTRFDIGIAQFDTATGALGSQADFAVTTTFMPGLKTTFGINNRHWLDQDYLHEGYLGLIGDALLLAGDTNLRLTVTTLAAASSQSVAAATVADARLAANSTLTFKTAPTALGVIDASIRGDVSFYPGYDRSQVALTLAPRWSAQLGSVKTELAYTRRFSNAASPFSTKLDRLEPVNKLSFGLSTSKIADVAVRASYNFLPDSGGVEALSVTGNFSFDELSLLGLSGLNVQPFFDADLARLLNPDLSFERRAYLELGTDLLGARWETGAAVRMALDPFAFEKVEARLSFPLDLGGVQVQPFVALDVLPSLTDAVLPRVSGHGLEVTWPTCCGTLLVGYRQIDNRFTTSLAVELGTAIATQAAE